MGEKRLILRTFEVCDGDFPLPGRDGFQSLDDLQGRMGMLIASSKPGNDSPRSTIYLIHHGYLNAFLGFAFLIDAYCIDPDISLLVLLTAFHWICQETGAAELKQCVFKILSNWNGFAIAFDFMIKGTGLSSGF